MSRLQEILEQQRLEQEAEQAKIQEAGGTVLDQILRDQFKQQRRGEEPELDIPNLRTFEGMGEAADKYADFAVNQLKNAPQSAMGQVEDFAHAVRHPLDTIESVGNIISSFLQKGSRKYAENIAGRELERRGEEEADAILEYYADRLGTPARAVKTLEEDPFGAMADVSPLGLLKRGAPPIDPLGLVGKTAQVGLRETGAPSAMYRHASGIKPSLLEAGESVAETGLRQGIGVSRAGLKHIDNIKEAIGGRIDELVLDATQSGVRIPKSQLNKYLDALIEENAMIFDAGDMKSLHKMRADFNKQFADVDTLSPKQVQDWKVGRYEKAYAGEASPEPTIARSAATKGQRQQGRGARQALEEKIPALARLNEDWGAVAQLRPFIANRIDAIAQADPGLAKTIRQTIANPKFEARIAIGLDRLARGDLGWVEKNFNTPEIRTLMALSGNMEELMQIEGLQ